MDRQLLIGKQEVTYGVDPAAAAANSIWAENFEFKLVDTRVEPNPAKPGVGAVASHTYGQHVTYSYEIPLVGSGVAGTAPKWGPVILAAGWSETIVAATSVTYALRYDPENSPSMSYTWRDGNRRKHLMLGCRQRVGLKLGAGQRPMLVINGIGLHVPVSLGAVLAHADANFTGWLDALPVADGTTDYTFDGITDLGIRELSFEQSDNVHFIDVPGQKRVFLAGSRKFTGQQKITTPLASAINFESKWVAGDVVTWSMVHDTTAGRIVTVNGRCQVLGPTYSRDSEVDVLSSGLELVGSSLTTDDDLSIVLT